MSFFCSPLSRVISLSCSIVADPLSHCRSLQYTVGHSGCHTVLPPSSAFCWTVPWSFRCSRSRTRLAPHYGPVPTFSPPLLCKDLSRRRPLGCSHCSSHPRPFCTVCIFLWGLWSACPLVCPNYCACSSMRSAAWHTVPCSSFAWCSPPCRSRTLTCRWMIGQCS